MDVNSQMTPIGYMQSVFKYKNGTPRQPQLCENAKGVLKIEKSVFNNPEHSLEGLGNFSHVWILFLFHKNNNATTKAKVRPPRLDGKRVGVFSTRSPHRPSPIGLSLARLDCVQGSSIHVSGIDILDGTPVLDVKPYIQEYDAPSGISAVMKADFSSSYDELSDDDVCQSIQDSLDDKAEETITKQTEDSAQLEVKEHLQKSLKDELRTQKSECKEKAFPCGTALGTENFVNKTIQCSSHHENVLNLKKICPEEIGQTVPVHHLSMEERVENPSGSTDGNLMSDIPEYACVKSSPSTVEHLPHSSSGVTSSWISEINLQLCVRFTERADQQLKLFSKTTSDVNHRLSFLKDYEEVKLAIINILSEDPRSVYRRNKCADSLYFFTVDRVHVTCWFDRKLAEVVRIQSIDFAEELLSRK